MIVLDSSAVIAILFAEASAPALVQRLALDPDRVMSVASYVETGAVLAGRRRGDRLRAIEDLNAFLSEARISLTAVDEAQARIALWARVRFGRGMGHGGVLSFGDTFSYALPRTRDAPLLFVGEDFPTTDVIAALDVSYRQPAL